MIFGNIIIYHAVLDEIQCKIVLDIMELRWLAVSNTYNNMNIRSQIIM